MEEADVTVVGVTADRTGYNSTVTDMRLEPVTVSKYGSVHVVT